jgi:5-methyltetrahydropteroyltriglutamate--homocysteine methyltransferase
MKRSVNRILATHVGSLTRPDDLLELYRREAPAETLAPRLRSAVLDVVRRQVDIGLDVVNDGEFGKPMTQETDYAAWATYAFGRLSGFEVREWQEPTSAFSQVMSRSRDRLDFADFYATGETGISMSRVSGEPLRFAVNVGPIAYTGQALLNRDIDNLKAALAEAGLGVEDAFLTAVATSVQIGGGEYYRHPEEQAVAVAEAMREEYKTITDAGLNVQIDDPILVNVYEWQYSTNGDLAGFRKWAQSHVELVNHGLEGIPEEQVRYHLCWGSWKGPHSADLPLGDVIDLILKVRASQYSVEAANVQHEHEWKVWKSAKLPDGKAVVPGVVTHKTNVLEHSEVVADRLVRYANAVGRDNVIAGADCGFGGRMHPQLAWAKLAKLAEGAALATRQLWQ